MTSDVQTGACVALEAAFASRRERLERELIRRALPASARAGDHVPPGTRPPPHIDSQHHISKYERACAEVIAEVIDVASSVERRLPAGAPERAAASRAMNAACRVVAGGSARARGERTQSTEEFAEAPRGVSGGAFASAFAFASPSAPAMSQEAAFTARDIAAAAARARASIGGGGAGCARTVSSNAVSSSAVAAAAEDARAAAESLESLAAAAESRAVDASLRTPRTALEGAAAQTWTHHRSSGEDKARHRCVRRTSGRGAPTLRRASNALESNGTSTSCKRGTRPTAARALADRAAAEAWGVYSRLAPSRAWRDRFVWDCRTVARTLRALDARARMTEESIEDAETETSKRRETGGERDARERRPRRTKGRPGRETRTGPRPTPSGTRPAPRDDGAAPDAFDDASSRVSACARMARAMCERAALLTVPTETILDAVADVRAAAASGTISVRFSHPPGDGVDRNVG